MDRNEVAPRQSCERGELEPRAKMKKGALNHVLGGWCWWTAEKSVRYCLVHRSEGGLQKDQDWRRFTPDPHLHSRTVSVI